MKKEILVKGNAEWTCDVTEHGNLWYFKLAERESPTSPLKKQMHVQAIIDVSDDGTVAGVEIIDYKMPRPPGKIT